MINIDYAESLISKHQQDPNRAGQPGNEGRYDRDPNDPVAEPNSGAYSLGGQQFAPDPGRMKRDPNDPVAEPTTGTYTMGGQQFAPDPGRMKRDPNDPQAEPTTGAYKIGDQQFAPTPTGINNLDDLKKYLEGMGIDPNQATNEQIASAFGGNVQPEMQAEKGPSRQMQPDLQPQFRPEEKGLLQQDPMKRQEDPWR